jgi:hypothetical protein
MGEDRYRSVDDLFTEQFAPQDKKPEPETLKEAEGVSRASVKENDK